uniref:Receptor-like serine/threonine-protein kinase n=2 Tax=Davidia involucrata TaxID=16924 RepID=A0A5B6YNQ8_DAVIN
MSLKSKKPWFFLFDLLLFILSFKIHLTIGADTISSGQSVSGNQTITSQGGVFELGFFNPPGNSQNYYIGIWYKRFPIKTTVWVANRNQPISDPSSSELKLLQNGNLVLLLRQFKTQIWSTNSTSNTANSTIAVLLDNGNLVIRDLLDSSNVIWQSFDYPTDTWLPGGKVGYNKLRNSKQSLTSWRSVENPATSLFSLEVEPNGTSHILLWNRSILYWNSGEWDGKIFGQVPEIALDSYITNLTYISNENESYFTYDAAFSSALTRFVINATGQLQQFVWRKDFPGWSIFWTRPTQQCEVYAFCGGFSSCTQNVPICDCMKGFEPRSITNWEEGDFSDGCVRKTPLQCNTDQENDTFSVMPNTRFPVNSESIPAGNIEECRLACLSNCSCTAFGYGNGCLVWNGELFNLQKLLANDDSGSDFHVRIARSSGAKTRTAWIIAGAVGGLFTLFGIVICLIIWRRKKQMAIEEVEDSLILFKYRELRIATKNFSEKLGEGGFGSVFKGTLPNSTTIAVKALKNLKEGEKQEKQFRAEVGTIGTIQHINLVRLRGFCVEGTKRFLVLDYMSNGSLESLLFRKVPTTNILDWKARYNIAIGIARGLAYLHEKCRDCIVHCDIKPENILLDAEYNPKVADFGLAKLIGREFSRVLTTIRGTRGYLAPEWISGEAITPKADVFSFGMLVFEIISGRRNRDLLNDGTDDYFPARVAKKMKEGEEEVLTLLDYQLEGNADVEEVTRACKVACWCIQDDEKDRPTMGQVVQILEGVSDQVGMPPIPRFLQGFAENPMEAMAYQEVSSSSCVDVSKAKSGDHFRL